MEALGRPHATIGHRLRFAPVHCFDAAATRGVRQQARALAFIALIRPTVESAVSLGFPRADLLDVLEKVCLSVDLSAVRERLADELADRILAGGGWPS